MVDPRLGAISRIPEERIREASRQSLRSKELQHQEEEEEKKLPQGGKDHSNVVASLSLRGRGVASRAAMEEWHGFWHGRGIVGVLCMVKYI